MAHLEKVDLSLWLRELLDRLEHLPLLALLAVGVRGRDRHLVDFG